MYIPTVNKIEDQEKIFELMEANPFATLVTVDNVGTPFATHMPVVLDRSRGPNGTLFSHIAKANPQWSHFDQAEEILIIFNGPHAYISPSWYTGAYNVPTWNYLAVHAYGKPKVIKDMATLQEILTNLVAENEQRLSPQWAVDWSDERNHNMMKAIVGFEMQITRLEAKSKLNQNKSIEDQLSVIKGLKALGNGMGMKVGEEMHQNLSD